MISFALSIRAPGVSLLLCSLITFFALPVCAADRVAAGQYEYTTTIDGKPQTFANCITAEEAKAFNGDAKAGRAYAENAAKGACKVTAYDVKGNLISYTMECEGSVITSSATYHGDSFEGDTTTTVTVEGKRVGGGTAHTKAKRVGACK